MVYGIHKNITYGLYSPSGLICKFMTNHDEPSEVGGRTVEEANDFWNCSNSKKIVSVNPIFFLTYKWPMCSCFASDVGL